ncbi:helix-turn-helix transcriptional regulator [Mariluticola halotolerans]|uniref:helix-turn-helix transcriptional regulator n=1 Tax=Mariluticola halotolerans TaxID=2909283 RepID=UPI0026E1DC56|nr:LuxR family transcriptional regulator [Mariluticola halotolerans]UJQ94123.1 LuxR family transcriptional regulator [Mariluticola halotolerans]
MQRIYEDFIESLSTSVNEKELQCSMTNLLVAFEVSQFAYLSLPPPELDQPRYISNYPEPWTSHYLRQRYQAIDPVITCAERSDTPFHWGKKFTLGDGSADQYKFFDEAAEFGICSGLTIPVRDRLGGGAVLTFVADEDCPALMRLVDRYTRALQLVATCYHIHVRRICSEENIVDGVRLTRRELECLQWAARGKSAWETGEILGITRRTVAFHLDNTRAKLGVRTVAQAISRLSSSNRFPG